MLTEIMKAKVELLNLDAQVRHISYTSEEAAELAGRAGLTPGTAKDVARLLRREINPAEMPEAADAEELRFLSGLEPELKRLESLFREVNILDNWLRPYERQAKSVGILMTPTLILPGGIRHSGSVPELSRIDRWLSELK